MNPSENVSNAASEGSIDPVGGGAGIQRELAITVGASLVFVLLMILQERQILVALNRDGTVPYLMWRLLCPVAMVAWAVLLPLKWRIGFLGLLGAFWSLVVVGDTAYFRFFDSITSLVSAGTVHQLWDVLDSVRDVLRVSDFFFLGTFVGLGALALLPDRILLNGSRPSTMRSRVLATLILASVLGIVGTASWFTPIYEDTHHTGRGSWVMPADHWESQYSYAAYASTFGLYNYHLRDLVRVMKLRGPRNELTPEHLAVVDQVLANKGALNRIQTPFEGIARGRRIVIIQLEAIVHWAVGLDVEGTPVMPFLNGLAQKGLSWDYVMDVTGMGRTSDAEFAVMTGLLPDTSRPNSFTNPDRARSYLPRALKAIGYQTASYHGYVKSFWNRSYTHPVYGFDEMYFDDVYGTDETLGLGVPDRIVYDFLLGRLADEDPLSFSFVISLTSHHPYVYTPAEYNGLFPKLSPDEGWGLLGPYLRSARYADDALAAYFEGMRARGMLEDTVFILYGDHSMGALHTDKTLPQMSPLSYTVAEERVPFIVYVPGREELIAKYRDRYTTATAGLQDTFPTIMHLLGEPVPPGVMGTNLLVPDELRDPVPLRPRMSDLLYAYRHAIYSSRGSGPIDPERPPDPSTVADAPTPIEGFRDQLIVRELLDHPEYWERSDITPKLAAISEHATPADLR